jgi:hypothetical protein
MSAAHVPLTSRPRIGDYHAFARDLIAHVERTPFGADVLGRAWDVEGDPLASSLVGLWAYVAEVVAAYAELTAAEAYLVSAADWTDLRRIAALVGHRPRPPVAAQGWIRVTVDKGADPVLPAGTRVQAPGTPERAAQTFEVAQDTPLRTDWNAFTATWVPVPAAAEGRRVRFLGDPGFRTGDRVLFVEERLDLGACGPQPVLGPLWTLEDWLALLRWMACVSSTGAKATALAVATVVSREDEIGTALVEFDRDLAGILSSTTSVHAAYRIEATAGEARRLSDVLQVTVDGVEPADVTTLYPGPAVDAAAGSIVLDATLETLSRDQTVALVDWASGSCDVLPVQAHRPVDWEIVPGTPTRASRLEFDTAEPIPTLAAGGPLTAYVVDRRVLARHHEFPDAPAAPTAAQLRLYPAPAVSPERVAVRTDLGGAAVWEVLACRDAAVQEQADGDDGRPVGLIVDLVDGPPRGSLVQAPAAANLALVRHGATARAVLGGGDAAQSAQRFTLPDAPIASDVNAAGSVVPTLTVSVDGVRWPEVPTLSGLGPVEAYTVSLDAAGGVTVEFGDGERGARLPTGRGSVTAAYRVGGGTAGEVESGAIDSLLGSIRGVKRVDGAGPTSGGADGDDERDLRRLAPGRARAFGRAVTVDDLVDLSRAYPGVTHATAWIGIGPPGCACAGTGLHLAFVRAGTDGPRVPEPSEIQALAGHLDARRDATVPLCVCAAALTNPPPRLEVVLAVEPNRDVAGVVAAAAAALADPDGPLDPRNRSLGQPLDRSDVYAVLHAVTGVAGVTTLVLPGSGEDVGRLLAARHELIVLDPAPLVGGAAA